MCSTQNVDGWTPRRSTVLGRPCTIASFSERIKALGETSSSLWPILEGGLDRLSSTAPLSMRTRPPQAEKRGENAGYGCFKRWSKVGAQIEAAGAAPNSPTKSNRRYKPVSAPDLFVPLDTSGHSRVRRQGFVYSLNARVPVRLAMMLVPFDKCTESRPSPVGSADETSSALTI